MLLVMWTPSWNKLENKLLWRHMDDCDCELLDNVVALVRIRQRPRKIMLASIYDHLHKNVREINKVNTDGDILSLYLGLT